MLEDVELFLFQLRVEEDMDQGHDSDMYILNQRSNNGGIGPEHLVKPSQMKQNSRERSSSKQKEHQRSSHHHSRQSSQQQPPPGE